MMIVDYDIPKSGLAIDSVWGAHSIRGVQCCVTTSHIGVN